ncbi:MAG: MATE family efflux transporter [Eggerthellaceae bacterium]|nr:MATE family efflux transporter [Eggerthellaceae bacterium]
MLVNGAYQVIDSIFLGHGVGELGLSTITVASPIMVVFMALSMLIGAGGNALCALRLGEGKVKLAEKILGNTVMLAIVVSALVAILAHIPAVIEWLLSLSSATEYVRPYAQQFIQIVSLGTIFQVIGMGINNFIRTVGAPVRALVTMIIGAVGCTFFNAIFVLALGWGIVGSALATVFGQAVSAATVVWYFVKTPNVPIRLRLFNMALKPTLVKEILTLGLAAFAIQAGAAIVNVATNFVLVKYGALDPLGADNALATIGVVQRVAMFLVLPLVGISIAIQPLLGFNYGARLFSRVRQTVRIGVIGATLLGTMLWLSVMIFARLVVLTFGIHDEHLVQVTMYALRIMLFMLPIVGLQIVGSNYFQATGQPFKSGLLALTRQLIFLVPALFMLPHILPSLISSVTPLESIYFATPVADTLSVCVTLIFLMIEISRLKKREQNNMAM